MKLQNLKKKPRADSTSARSDDQIHDEWALHEFAFEYETLPRRLIFYHPERMINDELMEGYYDEFIPVALDSPRGEVLKKEVDWNTTYCPECGVPARRTDKGEAMCPECGLICNDEAPYKMVRDMNSAGRIEGDAEGHE